MPDLSDTRTVPAPSRQEQEPQERALAITPPLINREDVCITFTRSRLAPSGPIDLALRQLSLSPLTPPTTQASVCTTSHLVTASSFATIFFGTLHRAPAITAQGYRDHGASLAQLNRALSNPACYVYDQVIVAVTTLAIQETLVPTGTGLFARHMRGLERLLELRDPAAGGGEGTLALYKCLRYMLVYAALMEGRATVLGRAEWKAALMRACVGEEERREQEVYDMLAECCGLVAERDGEGDIDMDGVRRRAQDLYEALQVWRWTWDADPAHSPLEPYLASTPTSLTFSSPHTTFTLLLFNVALIHVLRLLVSLHPSARHDYIAATHGAVLEIHRVVPSAENAELHVAPVVHCAVQTAREAVQGDGSVEARWLRGLLAGGRGGWGGLEKGKQDDDMA
jgi:hypothetical protein